jgi:hypothetical protein
VTFRVYSWLIFCFGYQVTKTLLTTHCWLIGEWLIGFSGSAPRTTGDKPKYTYFYVFLRESGEFA